MKPFFVFSICLLGLTLSGCARQQIENATLASSAVAAAPVGASIVGTNASAEASQLSMIASGSDPILYSTRVTLDEFRQLYWRTQMNSKAVVNRHPFEYMGTQGGEHFFHYREHWDILANQRIYRIRATDLPIKDIFPLTANPKNWRPFSPDFSPELFAAMPDTPLTINGEHRVFDFEDQMLELPENLRLDNGGNAILNIENNGYITVNGQNEPAPKELQAQ